VSQNRLMLSVLALYLLPSLCSGDALRRL